MDLVPIGNIVLLILTVPLIGVWVKILKTPYPILFQKNPAAPHS
jgi:TctA family transporter